MNGGRGPVLAIAVEPGRLSAGLVAPDGSTLVRDRVSMPSRDVWRSLERLVGRVLAAGPSVRFDAVGVSCVGPVDLMAGQVSPPYVPGWTSFALVEHLETLTGRPVVLESAGTAAAEAERWLGEARGLSSFVAVVVDAVVDSGCIIDGIRLQGAHGNAGSVAHLVVDPGGRPCWCGASGCLEPYVSSIALEAEMNRPLRQANPSLVERAGLMLGRALASMLAMVDVDTVFVSGGVVDAFGDPFLDTARRELERRSKLRRDGPPRLIEPVEHLSSLVRAASVAVAGTPG